jgi:hypothetical protein
MNICFRDLKKISQSLERKNTEVLLDYFNSYEGSNVFEKFRNILKSWEYDVSPSLSLNLTDKPVNISLSYILSELPENLGKEIEIVKDDLKIILDIPKTFDTIVQEETIPIYSLIQQINISGISINLIDLSVQEKRSIIDSLPARVYNTILNKILNNKDKIVGFNNPVLSLLKFNFLTNEPCFFLKGLFNNFSEDYFRDVIFHLSKRIDGNILMDSTPLDIEYYIQKYSDEVRTQNDGLTI